jgi:hypothetical protein
MLLVAPICVDSQSGYVVLIFWRSFVFFLNLILGFQHAGEGVIDSD